MDSLLPGVLQFKYEYSVEKLQFLDLEISKENGILETNLFIKPTNAQLYLEYRILERCSKEGDREKHFGNLKSKLLERKYPLNLIEEKMEKVKSKERKEVIFQERKQKKADDKVRLKGDQQKYLKNVSSG